MPIREEELSVKVAAPYNQSGNFGAATIRVRPPLGLLQEQLLMHAHPSSSVTHFEDESIVTLDRGEFTRDKEGASLEEIGKRILTLITP